MAENIAIDMDKIKETFFIESDEHISGMETLILELESRPADLETLNGIFRAAHSMKGNSGCLGMTDINQFTHSLETVLDRLRTGKSAVDREVISLLLKSLDCIKSLVDAAKNSTTCGPEIDETLDELKAMLGRGPVQADGAPERRDDAASVDNTGPAEYVCSIRFEPGPQIMKRGIDPINFLRELTELGEVLSQKIEASNVPPLEELDPETCYLSWEILLLTDTDIEKVRGFFDFVSDDSRLEIKRLGGRGSAGIADQTSTSAGPLEKKMLGEILVEEKIITPAQLDNALQKQKTVHREEATTIRVDIEKIDKLVTFVGEFVITQSMITRLASRPSLENFAMLKNIAAQLERNTREIQEKVMAIRMLQIGSVFNRFARLVRDLSQSNGKKIVLEVSGEETELDKNVIEKISDPLTHLLRNSVDHGIEAPAERIAKGKDETGIVKLSASHAGGYVLVTVEDDGKGLDKERIARKAVEKGIVEPGAVENMSPAQILNLIFLPGFSTAEKVTDISGRGVGMDVVKRNIEALGGSVSVESRRDEFARISLRLPLTLAIIDGLTVEIGEDTYVLPINAIVESLRPKREDVKMVKGEHETVCIRGSYIPVVRVHRLFGVAPRHIDPWNALVVVVTAKNGRYALLVDSLLGEQQIVIKSIGEAFRNLPGVAGATILGDGRVALILDIEGIVKKYQDA